jgi:hypothetical protein
MELTTADRSHGLIGLLSERWRAWKESRDSLAGLEACGRSEIARIAQDLSLTPRELRSLARKGSDAASLLYRRLADLGLDRDELARRLPTILRAMQTDCSFCDSKVRCRHDFARSAEPSAWHTYCPNDAVLNALAADGARRPRTAARATAVAIEGDTPRWHPTLLGLLFVGLAWVVLLTGHHPGPRRHAPPVIAPAAAPAPNQSAVGCLDASCLDVQQLAALDGLRAIQSQGWIASSAERRDIVSTASLIAQDVRAGEAAACARQGGTTYYGFLFDRGCSAGGEAAAKLEGYNECRPMAGGGACLR